MSEATAALAVRGIMDHIACGRQLSQANYSGGTDVRDRLDAAADRTFEDRCTGVVFTAAANALAGGSLWNADTLREMLAEVVSYARLDLACVNPYFSSYLTRRGMRAPWEFNESLFEALSTRALPELVFPKGTFVADEADPALAGMHQFGALTGGTPATYASVDGILDTTKIIGAPILVVSREATPGGTPTLTCTCQLGGTPKVIATAPSATQYGQSILGKQAITSVAGAVFGCAATAQFTEGEWVLLSENADGPTSLREAAKVKTIVSNTSLEFEAAPVNTFSAAGFILPMFTNCAVGTGNMTGGKHVDLYALPDRIIAV